MRIVYTIGLLIGVPIVFVTTMILMVFLEDFMQRVFGKPPVWVMVIGVSLWLFIFARMAWETAGKWLQ